MKVKYIEGGFLPSEASFTIVVGRFNSFVVDKLVEGALDTLIRHGIDRSAITVVKAPGAFELPLVTQKIANKRKSDAIIALGAVIRGGTPHFEYVASECTKGLAQVSLQYDIPVAFGVLTVDTIEQAIERSGTKAGNKGIEAAMSALEMVNLIAQLEK